MPAGGPADAAERLQRYRSLRDFAATPEPDGASRAAPGEAPRFVVHEHHARRLHWDLRLERNGVLASWAIPKGLPPAPGENHLAVWTEDHPLAYLDFDGEIPAGQYGAGRMTVWDRGTYECLKWEPRKIELALHGKRVRARYALFPIAAGEQPKEWMIHRIDPPSDARHEPLPDRIAPMLARAGELPREDAGWSFEVKWDGVRAIAFSRPGELRLQSRNYNDITAGYPELAQLGRALSSHSAVLDGELVALDQRGLPSFARLQRRMHVTAPAQVRRLAASVPVTYMIFDLLWLDGHSLLELPYSDRRELLTRLDLEGAAWRTPPALAGSGAQVLRATAAQHLEGILAKRLDSAYLPGQRSGAWLKIKHVGRQELVVGGWVPGKGRRGDHIGALLLGVHDDAGELHYAGRVGSGFSDAELQRLRVLLEGLRVEDSPFTQGRAKPPREAVFCRPQLVAEVEFTEWTAAGSLRHPVYLGLREDKPASEVRRESPAPEPGDSEQAPPGPTRSARGAAAPSVLEVLADLSGQRASVEVEGHELRLSNLSKVLYPSDQLSKRGVIGYYAAIAPVLLGHLAGRALTVTRWPDGVEGKSFFQKQAPAHRPDWVATTPVGSRKGTVEHVLADDLATLLWLANLAALELHVPLHRAATPTRPAALVFDLDPGAPASILECCRVAVALEGMLSNLGLRSFAKTSGSKGLQVYVPLNSPAASYEQTKSFARAVAETFEQAMPELVVARMTRELRGGRVLIDWSQNDPNKTTVCVYSLRATARPMASTPVDWEEVRATLASEDPGTLAFDFHACLARAREHGDRFAPLLSIQQELPGVTPPAPTRTRARSSRA